MNTAFLLMAQYQGRAVIPAESVCSDYFPHLKLDQFIRNVGAAEMQAAACDDKIIMGHLRDAYRDTIALRRQVFAAVREAETA